jgi:transposase
MAESGIQVTQLQHLGLVAGMCNEIGLIDCIDRFIQKPKRKVSVGQAVQAMVLNGLGFTGRALYLTPRFFKNRPVETLIGEGITADDLHDDCLGTALDALYEKGITELFYHIAGQALARQNIEYRFVHLDSTTFSLHGQYDGKQADDPDMVTITKGYSKDRAPDLNQVVTTLMCSHRSTLPVWLEVLSGNASDINDLQRKYPQIPSPIRFTSAAVLRRRQCLVLQGLHHGAGRYQMGDPGSRNPCPGEAGDR